MYNLLIFCIFRICPHRGRARICEQDIYFVFSGPLELDW